MRSLGYWRQFCVLFVLGLPLTLRAPALAVTTGIDPAAPMNDEQLLVLRDNHVFYRNLSRICIREWGLLLQRLDKTHGKSPLRSLIELGLIARSGTAAASSSPVAFESIRSTALPTAEMDVEMRDIAESWAHGGNCRWTRSRSATRTARQQIRELWYRARCEKPPVLPEPRVLAALLKDKSLASPIVGESPGGSAKAMKLDYFDFEQPALIADITLDLLIHESSRSKSPLGSYLHTWALLQGGYLQEARLSLSSNPANRATTAEARDRDLLAGLLALHEGNPAQLRACWERLLKPDDLQTSLLVLEEWDNAIESLGISPQATGVLAGFSRRCAELSSTSQPNGIAVPRVNTTRHFSRFARGYHLTSRALEHDGRYEQAGLVFRDIIDQLLFPLNGLPPPLRPRGPWQAAYPWLRPTMDKACYAHLYLDTIDFALTRDPGLHVLIQDAVGSCTTFESEFPLIRLLSTVLVWRNQYRYLEPRPSPGDSGMRSHSR